MAAGNILINITAKDNATKTVKKTEKAVTSLGRKGKQSLRQITTASADTLDTLNSLGNRFRYLSMVTGVFAAGAVLMGKSLVDASREGEAAMMKLGVMAITSGQSIDKANEAAKELASTGLMTLHEASTGLANLLASDLNLPQATKLIKRMLDTAVLAKESLTDTFGQAIIKSTLGVRIFQERQVDAIGINFRMDQVVRAHGKTLRKTTEQMTNAEKHQAIYNHLMKESERFVGGAELATTTFGGALSQLSASVNILKIELGNTLIPIVGELAEIFKRGAKGLNEFTKEHMGLVGALLMGTIVASTFVAAFATIGALVPMVSTGIGLTTKGLALLASTTVMLIAKFLILAVVIGGLVYLILKVTGVWDKWQNKIRDVQKRISELFKPMEDLGDKAKEASERAVKAFKKIKDSITLTVRSFREGMREWAEKHDETITKLKADIASLQTKYSEATKRIRDDFKQTMSDLDIAHARTSEDLQREIDEEVSKGIWADQTRIRDLKLRLKRENEDYERSKNKNETRRDEELTDEEKRLNTRLSDLQTELNEELALEKKHSVLIAKARTWPILDEIEKRTRTYRERLEQYKTELNAVQSNAAAEKNALDDVTNSVNDLGIAADITKDKLSNMASSPRDELARMNTLLGVLSSVVNSYADTFYNNWQYKIIPVIMRASDKMHAWWKSQTPKNKTGDILGLSDWMYSKWKGLGFQEGGVVPGVPGTPVPITAHAGETIIPAGASPITININNPSVREEQDIVNIANAVKDVLSRQQYLKHLK